MTLTQIAFLMRREARRGLRARRTLRRGLTLTLWRERDDWFLSLARQDQPPGETEIAVCRNRFDVPEDAAVETSSSVVVLRWSDPPARQLSLLDDAGLGSDPAGKYYQE